jgi:hypothetical protein
MRLPRTLALKKVRDFKIHRQELRLRECIEGIPLLVFPIVVLIDPEFLTLAFLGFGLRVRR